MPYKITANEIKDGWQKLIKKILKEGKPIKDERGTRTLEILNAIVEIQRPFRPNFYHINEEIETPKGYFWSGEKLKEYANQFLKPDKKGFIYTYGNRLRSHFKVDQVEEAIKRLKNFKKTRRATMITWDPQVDTKEDEVPCMILIDFKIRGNKLYTTGVWRSHDIYGAWFPNAVGLAHLAKYVAEKTGTKVGPITIHSISAHIYEVNFEEAKKMMR
ncbi:MAG TPA: thymidylate synthase [Methanothermobacter sp.]|mgnify:FL=1|jgi:thymidylate synthase|uniref:Thymidylate synthase n=1 Tax=Methanothermobacter tenebrarum TaxID=680118 RepID=A0ABM7YD10_9EURY|nr:thymidylate synthase [Methanothermobacter tenebrarum]MDD3453893.1 thymidylate synthase [Methanobacteriales archaeon]MDI6882764.1 thymidylate synthase [Methanothermobacter sp.]MDX9692604.1 thymidylate synthase [Methanothermobacter sp.]BDH79235.1 thymidylate synthase [Methanothermobacter tenebrarum]HHW16241.1 thymidylate synthase [Methanothermobacter sp.]